MSAYYSDDQVAVYHGDCLEVDAWLEADVLVTDPPYGIGWKQGKTRKSRKQDGITNDADTAQRDRVLEVWRDKLGVVFGSPLVPAPAGAVQALVYQKPHDAGIFGARAGFRRDWELIYLTGPWPCKPPTRSGILKTKAPSVVSLVASRYPNDTGAGHPHTKPLDVMEELISACHPGVVADPFAGAGSTLIAARNLGRKAIGVEIEERYCELIAKRLSQGCLDFGEVS